LSMGPGEVGSIEGSGDEGQEFEEGEEDGDNDGEEDVACVMVVTGGFFIVILDFFRGTSTLEEEDASALVTLPSLEWTSTAGVGVGFNRITPDVAQVVGFFSPTLRLMMLEDLVGVEIELLFRLRESFFVPK